MAGIDLSELMQSNREYNLTALPAITERDALDALECVNPSTSMSEDKYLEWAAAHGATK